MQFNNPQVFAHWHKKLFTDGVVLIDPEYFEKEGKQDRKGANLHTIANCD